MMAQMPSKDCNWADCRCGKYSPVKFVPNTLHEKAGGMTDGRAEANVANQGMDRPENGQPGSSV